MSESQMNRSPEACPTTVASAASGSASAGRTDVELTDEWWRSLDQRVYQCIKLWFEQWWEPQHNTLLDIVGDAFRATSGPSP
jgi:hypothetical protein